MITIYKRFRFSAAHRLPMTHVNHKCHALHGHNFVVNLTFKGPIAADGFLIDFGDVSKAWAPIDAVLDHKYLNDIPGLENPTSEVIAMWVWERMVAKIPCLVAVEVKETDDSGAIYEGD